jgi:hypothetical protein
MYMAISFCLAWGTLGIDLNVYVSISGVLGPEVGALNTAASDRAFRDVTGGGCDSLCWGTRHSRCSAVTGGGLV